MAKIYVKIKNIDARDYNYLVNHGLCKVNKKTLSFTPTHYHLYKISGLLK